MNKLFLLRKLATLSLIIFMVNTAVCDFSWCVNSLKNNTKSMTSTPPKTYQTYERRPLTVEDLVDEVEACLDGSCTVNGKPVMPLDERVEVAQALKPEIEEALNQAMEEYEASKEKVEILMLLQTESNGPFISEGPTN